MCRPTIVGMCQCTRADDFRGPRRDCADVWIMGAMSSVRIPVKLVDGHWEFFYGGALPVKDGSMGDLVVSMGAIKDPNLLRLLTNESKHKILDEGVELLVALTIRPEPQLSAAKRRRLIPRDAPGLKLSAAYYDAFRSQDTQFVKIRIGPTRSEQGQLLSSNEGGVWLHLQGMQPKRISTSSVIAPVGRKSFESLNYAFTRLSEIYEPWRMSHTGNIYQRFLYQEKNGKWYPLDVLRNTAMVKKEGTLMRELWSRIAHELGLADQR